MDFEEEEEEEEQSEAEEEGRSSCCSGARDTAYLPEHPIIHVDIL